MKRLIRALLAIGCHLLSLGAAAQGSTTEVVFINGIKNTRQQAIAEQFRIQEYLRMYSNRPEGSRRAFSVALIYNPKGFYENETDLPGCDAVCQDLNELLVLKAAEEEYASFFPRILSPHQQSAQLDVAAATFIKRFADTPASGSNSAIERGIVTAERMAATRNVIAQIATEMKRDARKIIVAHSQGNLLANLAWASAVADIGQEARARSRVVNLANTSLFAVSNLNSTHDKDVALEDLVVEPLVLNFSRSTVACNGVCQFDLARPTFQAPAEFVCGGRTCNHAVATYIGGDHATIALVDQSVRYTPDRTTFFDRFEDLLYAAVESMEGIQSVYQQDFTSDPGWQTDQLTNFYWNASNQTYFARAYSGAPPIRPNRYGMVRLPSFDPNRGFTLSWDQRLNTVSENAIVHFGLFSGDRLTGRSTFVGLPPLTPKSTVNFGIGRALTTLELHQLNVVTKSGESQGGGGAGGIRIMELGSWYRVSITYDPVAGEMRLAVTNPVTGATTHSRTGPVAGANPFDPDMQYLGVGNDPIGYAPGSVYSETPNGYLEAEFDNVSLTYLAPPATYTPTLAFSPRIVPFGGTATLTWNTGGAPVTACTLSRGGTQQPTLTATTGSLTVTNIQGRITYTLTCGSTSVSATVEIVPVVQ